MSVTKTNPQRPRFTTPLSGNRTGDSLYESSLKSAAVKEQIVSPPLRMRLFYDPESYDETDPPERHRYWMQVCFPVSGEEEIWETINSFLKPLEALRGCSQCYDIVRDLLDIEFNKDLAPGYVKIRILDAQEQRLIFWEVASGGLAEAFTDEDRPVPRRNTQGNGV